MQKEKPARDLGNIALKQLKKEGFMEDFWVRLHSDPTQTLQKGQLFKTLKQEGVLEAKLKETKHEGFELRERLRGNTIRANRTESLREENLPPRGSPRGP